MLSKEEIKRYARHLSLENVGMSGQEKLKEAKVLVIGAGGLGAPVLQYLSAAGVGTIGVIDHDVVDVSNLQRQVIFTTEDIGKPKAMVVVDRLSKLNPFVQFNPTTVQLDVSNALEVIAKYDIIIDGTDNFVTRYLVNDACLILGKPFVHGSIFKFQGQLSVFNYQDGPSYRCLYPESPSTHEAPNCSDVGVLGVLPGIIGTRMASECLKMILGKGTVLSGSLEIVDLLNNTIRKLKFERNEEHFKRSVLEKDYSSNQNPSNIVKEATSPLELQNDLKSKDLVLLDVREPFELEICSFDNSLNIPLNEIPNRLNEIPRDQHIVAVCHHGIRSANAITFLKNQGWNKLSNLKGGIHAWAVEVDPNMAQY